jgi:hypothetical protein
MHIINSQQLHSNIVITGKKLSISHTNNNDMNIKNKTNVEEIQVFFSINTGLIFIAWKENKYFMRGGSHQ